MTYVLSVTLASGETLSIQRRTIPRRWKSLLIRSLPLGTDGYGAQFQLAMISD